MKKYFNLFLALFGSFAMIAQCPEAKEGAAKSSDVTSAYSAYSEAYGGDPLEAAPLIDRAIKDEKSASKEKTWRYRGDIYAALATLHPEACPEALARARESYNMAKEKDLKGRSDKDNNQKLINVGYTAFNSALEAYNASEYPQAATHFELASGALGDAEQQADSVYMISVFNSGLSYDNAGVTDKAVALYEKSIEIGYEPKQCLYRIIASYQVAENSEAELATIQKGITLFPEEPEFLIQLTNYYLRIKDFASAEGNLQKAIDNDPNNAMLHFVLGTALDQLEKTDEAVNAYKKAIEIDPEYLDAYHNLGASYVNSSVSLKEEANNLDRSKRAEYDQLQIDANDALKNALPYLEKALELEPDNLQVMNSLKSIYFTFNRMDDYNAMKDKIEKM